MDPLAITASVIAVIGAAKKVNKSLRLLKDVKDAPDGLRDLLDHISRFESFLRASERGVPESDTDAPELRERLLEAKAKLVEIDQFAQYTLTEAGESSKVDRWQWVQKRSVVERFKRQLDEIRQDVMSLTHAGS